MECAVFVVKIQDGTGLYRVSWTNLCTTGFLMPASTDLVASIKERNTGNAILVTPANEIYTEPVNNGSQVNRYRPPSKLCTDPGTAQHRSECPI